MDCWFIVFFINVPYNQYCYINNTVIFKRKIMNDILNLVKRIDAINNSDCAKIFVIRNHYCIIYGDSDGKKYFKITSSSTKKEIIAIIEEAEEYVEKESKKSPTFFEKLCKAIDNKNK